MPTAGPLTACPIPLCVCWTLNGPGNAVPSFQVSQDSAALKALQRPFMSRETAYAGFAWITIWKSLVAARHIEAWINFPEMMRMQSGIDLESGLQITDFYATRNLWYLDISRCER